MSHADDERLSETITETAVGLDSPPDDNTAIPPIMELASLPQRHGEMIGKALLIQFGHHVIIRMSMDPVQQEGERKEREIHIHHRTEASQNDVGHATRRVGWNNLPEEWFSEEVCFGVRLGGRNDIDISEGAAVGIMALLIHELEGLTVREVAQIGCSGDYYVSYELNEEKRLVEVSGLREDGNGSATKTRLRDKSEQVLRKSETGYASVTAFAHATERVVFSYLHWVRREQNAKTAKKRRRSKR